MGFFSRFLEFYSTFSILVGAPALCVAALATLMRVPFAPPRVVRWGRYTLGAYLLWMLLLDRHTPVRGGRRRPFLRSLCLWRYMRRYFSAHLVKDSGDPDPKGRYLIAIHPHGIVSFGTFCNLVGNPVHAFPGLDYRVVTVSANFLVPIWRELILGLGFADADRSSVRGMLESNISVGIVVGGAAESLESRPGVNDLTLNRRYGFIRLAMETGASLIPVFTYGETDLFAQAVPNPQGSIVRRFQNGLMRMFGFTVPAIYGRTIGLGIMPFRRRLLTVIGAPIPSPLCPTPTLEQVQAHHARYVAALHALYNKYRPLAHALGVPAPELRITDRPPGERELDRIRADLQRRQLHAESLAKGRGVDVTDERFRFRAYGLPDEFAAAKGLRQAVGWEEEQDLVAAAESAIAESAVAESAAGGESANAANAAQSASAAQSAPGGASSSGLISVIKSDSQSSGATATSASAHVPGTQAPALAAAWAQGWDGHREGGGGAAGAAAGARSAAEAAAREARALGASETDVNSIRENNFIGGGGGGDGGGGVAVSPEAAYLDGGATASAGRLASGLASGGDDSGALASAIAGVGDVGDSAGGDAGATGDQQTLTSAAGDKGGNNSSNNGNFNNNNTVMDREDECGLDSVAKTTQQQQQQQEPRSPLLKAQL